MVRYDYVSPTEFNGLFKAMKNGLWGLIDCYTKEELVKCQWDTAPTLVKGHIVVMHKGKMGIVCKDGKEIIPIEYKDIIVKSSNVLIAIDFDDKYTLFDVRGVRHLPVDKYDYLEYHESEFIIVSLEGKYGVIRLDGSVRIPFIYEEIKHDSSDGILCRVRQNGKYGVINIFGNVVIPSQYDDIYFLRGYVTYIVAKSRKRSTLLNERGEELVGPRAYKYIDCVYDDLFIVGKRGLKGIVKSDGTRIVDFKYNTINSIGENIFKVDNKYAKLGLINCKGKRVCICRYDNIYSFVNGIAGVKYKGKYGFVTREGKPMTKIKYDGYKRLNVDYIAVKIENVWGVIDRSGKEITKIIYDEIVGIDDVGHIKVVYEKVEGEIVF